MEKYDVFISYSRKDTAIADKICEALRQQGITFFIDRKGIGGGMEFPAVLAEAIDSSRLMLFLASENSYQSKFTNSEVTYAFNEKPAGYIFPYIIDGSRLPKALRFTLSSVNVRNMQEHPIDTTLMQDVCQLLGREYTDVAELRRQAEARAEEQKAREAEQKAREAEQKAREREKKAQQRPPQQPSQAKAAQPDRPAPTAPRQQQAARKTPEQTADDEPRTGEFSTAGCLWSIVVVAAVTALAVWLGIRMQSVWIGVATWFTPMWILFWIVIQRGEYHKVRVLQKRNNWNALMYNRKRNDVTRDLVVLIFMGLMFGVGVAVGLRYDSFWIGAATWLVPSVLAFFYTSLKSGDQ